MQVQNKIRLRPDNSDGLRYVNTWFALPKNIYKYGLVRANDCHICVGKCSYKTYAAPLLKT